MKKRNTIILSVLLGFFLGYALLFYFLNQNFHSSKGYLLVSSLGGFYCNQGSCKYEAVDDITLDEKKFHIYRKNKYDGDYTLKRLNRYNFFQDGKWKSMVGDFLGIEESLDAQVLDFSYEEYNETDYNHIFSILKQHGILSYKHLNTKEAFVCDLDQNGVMDRIIAVSNQTDDGEEEKYFSLLLVLLNGKLNEIYFEEGSEIFSLPFYDVFSILQIDQDRNSYLIINKGYYDQIGEPSIFLLQLDGKNIKEVAK